MTETGHISIIFALQEMEEKSEKNYCYANNIISLKEEFRLIFCMSNVPQDPGHLVFCTN